MTLQELREKNTTDLTVLLAEKRALLRELTFKASEAQLKEIHSIRAVRSDIARILTVLREHTRQQSAS